MKLSVIVPVFNEYLTIRETIRLIRELPLNTEIIVVDDGSTDGTTRLLKEIQKKDSNIIVFYSDKNRGKGWALRKGLEQVTGDIVIFQDADLEYRPDEYPRLIQPIVENKADVVFGSRFTSTRRILYYSHYLGNKVLNGIAGIALRINISDIGTGCKVFRSDVIKGLHLHADSFGIETEITAKVLKKNYRLFEMPVSYFGRTYDEGKKTSVKTFFQLIYWMFKSALFSKEMGTDTLYKMKHISKYNAWIFRQIKPYIGDQILEVGSGIGNISRFLVGRKSLILTDINPYYVDILKRRFGGNEEIYIKKMNILEPDSAFLNQRLPDTVIMLNVLEHIENEKRVLTNINTMLPSGGCFVVLVPAIKELYGSLDKNLDHVKRYSKKELLILLESHGFEVSKIFYHNMIGTFGWFLNARILKRRYVSGLQTSMFDRMVPFFEWIERKIKPQFGLSLITVCKKKQ